jgi:serine/threonine-protein kinase
VIGRRISNFRIVAQLGAGGMGEVFLAEHEKIGTRVAIKMLQPHISANTEHVQRFFNEAIAVSKIHHAGVAKIFDVGFEEHGRAYLVMEFLDGETLAARIARLGRLRLAMVSDIGRQITSVLEAVHRAGITHRDLKPDNIFMVPDSELASGERVKILDFGIAKLSDHSVGLTATASGSMGTPAYMSPEQWRNSKQVDWRADAYSLGCLAFEMAAGRPPFIAETIGQACSKHLTEEAPRLATIVAAPAAPPPLDALIASLLAKDPDHRPPTMRDIGDAFAALSPIGASMSGAMRVSSMPAIPATLQGRPIVPNTTLGAAASAHYPTRPARSRKLLALLLLGLVALAGIATVVALSVTTPSPDPVASTLPPDPPRPADRAVAVDAPAATPIDAAPELAATPPRDAGVAPSIDASVPARVTIKKQPGVPTVRGTGKLVVRASPFSDVFEGRRRLGSTPLSLPMSAGTHILTFKNPNRPSVTQSVTVIAGETVELMVTLPAPDELEHRPNIPRCDEAACANGDDRCCARFRNSEVSRPPRLPPPPLPPITTGIAGIRGRVQNCGTSSGVSGLVNVKIRVGSDGFVETVTVLASPDPVLGTCVAAAVRTARFPSSPPGSIFTFPFTIR